MGRPELLDGLVPPKTVQDRDAAQKVLLCPARLGIGSHHIWPPDVARSAVRPLPVIVPLGRVSYRGTVRRPDGLYPARPDKFIGVLDNAG